MLVRFHFWVQLCPPMASVWIQLRCVPLWIVLSPTLVLLSQDFWGLLIFIVALSVISARWPPLLRPLTLTKSRFTWSDAAQETFDRLKELFTSAPILITSDTYRQLIEEVDSRLVAHPGIRGTLCVTISLCVLLDFFVRLLYYTAILTALFLMTTATLLCLIKYCPVLSSQVESCRVSDLFSAQSPSCLRPVVRLPPGAALRTVLQW